MPRAAILVVAIGLAGALCAGRALAGHESPFYPSFYPQEIRVETVAPAAAALRLATGALHAYAGDVAPRGETRAVPSLAGFVVVAFNPDRPGDRCAALPGIARALAAGGGMEAHPYPVTPYHGDYVEHADLALGAAAAEGQGPLALRAASPEAAALIPAAWRAEGAHWDAQVEVVDLDALLAPHRVSALGWAGPPHLRAGWFHAWLLAGERGRARAADAFRRLTGGGVSGAEQADLARRLVADVTGGCERAVAGYRLRREAYSAEYSEGIENVAVDAHEGVASAVFVRTAKLKDFPWNGWMRIGVATRPAAPWNPLGGFGDPAGRLIWAAVGDPAFLPHPYGTGWVENRATVQSVEGPGPIPAGAARFGPAEGSAAARIRYRILASLFHDGTRTTTADILYALHAGKAPAALAALRVVTVDRQVLDLGGGLRLAYEVPVIDVYLRAPAGPEAVAPWTTVPWHLLALVEAAGGRPAEMDLVRDQALKMRLASLVDRFAREGYVPAALAGQVTAAEARERWAALRKFFKEHGHFLVANGPYRLDQWTPDGAVLAVFRDLTYPLGVGTFDRFALPRRAFVTRAEVRAGRLEVQAEVERVFRAGRGYEIVREPFAKPPDDPKVKETLACRYVVVGADGRVVRAGAVTVPPGADRITIDLGPAGPGRRLVVFALSLDGNDVRPDVKVVPWTS